MSAINPNFPAELTAKASELEAKSNASVEFKNKCEEVNLDLDIQTAVATQMANIGKKISNLKEIPKCLTAFLEKTFLGWTTYNPKLEEMTFDADAIINKMMGLLDKLLAADAVVPPPPGLSELKQILDILKKLSQKDPDAQKVIAEKPELGKLDISIPPDIWDSCVDLGKTVFTIVSLFPVLLIKLIFNMLNTIVGMFKQIQGIIGVPPIPYPLTLIPQATELVGTVYDAMVMTEPTIKAVIKKKIKDKLKEINALFEKMSSLADSVQKPDLNSSMLEQVPSASAMAASVAASAAAKAKEQASKLKDALKKQEESDKKEEIAAKKRKEGTCCHSGEEGTFCPIA